MIMMIVTLVVNNIFYGLVLLRTREDASIFTSSVVVAYILYLQWSALSSSPIEECNPFYDIYANVVFKILAGLFFTLISLLMILSSSKTDEETI